MITSLRLYPVKSCGPVEVPKAELTLRGFRDDRRWMFVDSAGDFITQRTSPALRQVATSLFGKSIRMSHSIGSIEIPRAHDGERMQVRVWDSIVDAVPFAGADEWATRVIGSPARVVYMPEDVKRSTNPKRSREGDHVSFADGYPVHICTEASLADLNRRMIEPVPMSRFRPNVVVSGTNAFEEDEWSALTLGSIHLRVAKVTDRCMIVAFDDNTHQSTREPLRTLATFRKVDHTVYFGIHAIPDSEGTIQVGDAVGGSRTCLLLQRLFP